DKFKSMAFTNFYHSLINDKEEQLNKEELEAMQAKTKVDQIIYDIEHEEAQLKKLESQLMNMKALQLEYKNLMIQKAALIRTLYPDRWEEIDAKYQEIENIKLNIKETNEAIIAGNAVMSHVEKIQASLKSAAGWGTYDIIGGGMIATMIKRGHMEDAQSEINACQYTLVKFQNELEDVGAFLETDLSTGGLLGFADLFFDGFIVDLMVQSKITQGRENINQLYSKVSKVLSELRTHFNDEEKKMTQLEIVIEEKVRQI
ncbi:MAG: hypothetical protein PF505_13575, partial [Vallitaleaceae bacterium]|nr:hypothetical protein [Vallitaleaceae bacterium]